MGQDLVPKIKIVAALKGDKAWFTTTDYRGGQPSAAHMRQTVYLEVIPVILAPLKGPGFKVEAAGEDKVGGQAVVVLKLTCPNGKALKISLDKVSGLSVKAVGMVFTLDDDREVTQEITYGNYKDFGGIKVATKLEVNHGSLVWKQEVTEFKVLDKVDPATFTLPKEYDLK